MNATAHYYCWLQPAPTRPVPKLLWADLLLLVPDAFVRTNRRAIAMMFVSLSVWDGRAL